jgi:nitric oxide synthase oxygenase domain/subunit
MNEVSDESQTCGREQAERAKTQAWEAVNLLEQARELLTEDSVTQPAVKHLDAALYDAKARATVLEDWYQRTYGDGKKGSA